MDTALSDRAPVARIGFPDAGAPQACFAATQCCSGQSAEYSHPARRQAAGYWFSLLNQYQQLEQWGDQ